MRAFMHRRQRQQEGEWNKLPKGWQRHNTSWDVAFVCDVTGWLANELTGSAKYPKNT